MCDTNQIFINNFDTILQFENLTKDKVGKVYYKSKEGYILDMVVNPMSFVIVDDVLKYRPQWINNTLILENVLITGISSNQKCSGQIHQVPLYEGNKMTFKEQLQKGLEEIDHKLRHKVFQLEETEEKIRELENQMTEMYQELVELEKEKIKIENHIKDQ